MKETLLHTVTITNHRLENTRALDFEDGHHAHAWARHMKRRYSDRTITITIEGKGAGYEVQDNGWSRVNA